MLDIAGISSRHRVLDAGCGNDAYLRALAAQAVRSAGCDLSLGMPRSVAHRVLATTDVAALRVRDGAFEVVLAVHMLYHVPDRPRRLLSCAGCCGLESALRRRVTIGITSQRQG